MPEDLIFVADHWSVDSLNHALGSRVDTAPVAAVEEVYLDTFDWRLHQAGCQLVREREDDRASLRWRAPHQTALYVLPIEDEVRFSKDLPDGFLRSQLEPLIEVRALLPMGAAEIERLPIVVRDNDGNTLARILVDRLQILDPDNVRIQNQHFRLTVQQVSPRQRPLRRIIEAVENCGGRPADRDEVLGEVVAGYGRSPGDYSSKLRVSLHPEQRADDAVRTILRHLLSVATVNVDGVIDDVDPEFLHDLRVAVRRGRSLLGQVKRVLPEPAVEELVADLKWLGSSTNRLRDLDVFLDELTGYGRQLGSDARLLGPVERLIRRDRRAALRRVRSALRTRRFERLIAQWSDVVEEVVDEPESINAARPVAEVANARIFKAYRRMVTRGANLDDPPPPEAMHRLRIDGKKLRYLLEFFSSLYPAKVSRTAVKELKAFQDLLGGYNDVEVQRAHLTEIAEQVVADGDGHAQTVLALGRLTSIMDQRQLRYRREFRRRFEDFSSTKIRKLFATTFGGG